MAWFQVVRVAAQRRQAVRVCPPWKEHRWMAVWVSASSRWTYGSIRRAWPRRGCLVKPAGVF
eukprot:366268-Chlamydomonas_euryale.AAC.3